LRPPTIRTRKSSTSHRTPLNPSYSYNRDGYLIIRKSGSAPTNIHDGYLMGDFFGPDTTTADEGIDFSPDDGSINGAQAGYVNYYSIFAYWHDGDGAQMSYDWDNNRFYNTEEYIFSGPIVTSVAVPMKAQLSILDERTIDSSDIWTSGNLIVGVTVTTTSHACILEFDTSNISGFTIDSAELTLTNSNNFAMDEDLRLDRINYDWTGNEWLADVISDTFVAESDYLTFTLSDLNQDTATTISDVALTSIEQDWANGVANYGFRIMAADPMMANDFMYEFNSASDAYPPALEVTYMIED